MKSIITLVLLIMSVVCLEAQNLKVPTLSPYTEIRQEVGLTEIVLSYSRPSAKGRTIFGDLVPFDETWRTGANASTKLTFEEDVKIAGNPLTAGTYALYTIPGSEEWTIIIHSKTDMRSIAGGRVKPENDAFRFTVRPIPIPMTVETFTIQFSDITTNSCQLQLTWANTLLQFPIEVEVDANIEAQMEAFLKDPESTPHRVYFRAAEYNLHNKKDLNQAMEWIDAALEKSKMNYRYGLLKAKIHTALGNKEKAFLTAKTAHQWAKAGKNANYMEQTKVYMGQLRKDVVSTKKKKLSPYSKDVKSLDKIMETLYASISGDKGKKRDWARFQYLFTPEARLIPSNKSAEGKIGYRIMSPADYVRNNGSYLEDNGFHEVEISRKVEEFGSLVHVFSTYESFRSKSDDTPIGRGINSIQLMNDGERWWIMQIYWRNESEELPLPLHYLPKE